MLGTKLANYQYFSKSALSRCISRSLLNTRWTFLVMSKYRRMSTNAAAILDLPWPEGTAQIYRGTFHREAAAY